MPKMKQFQCPGCGSNNTYVNATRLVGKGPGIWRRHGCRECSHRFSTHQSYYIDGVLPPLSYPSQELAGETASNPPPNPPRPPRPPRTPRPTTTHTHTHTHTAIDVVREAIEQFSKPPK